jgi:hypothetical protein
MVLIRPGTHLASLVGRAVQLEGARGGLHEVSLLAAATRVPGKHGTHTSHGQWSTSQLLPQREAHNWSPTTNKQDAGLTNLWSTEQLMVHAWPSGQLQWRSRRGEGWIRGQPEGSWREEARREHTGPRPTPHSLNAVALAALVANAVHLAVLASRASDGVRALPWSHTHVKVTHKRDGRVTKQRNQRTAGGKMGKTVLTS